MAAPAVREFARELGVEIEDVAGTQSDGRISRDDVISHVRDRLGEARELEQRVRREEREPAPDLEAFGEVERRPMSSLRRTIASNVARSWRYVPQVSQFDEADVSELEHFRREVNEQLDGDVRLTVTAILVKVVAEVLSKFPDLGSALDLERAEIVHPHFVNIGVAVDTEAGLLVPVIRDADQRDLVDISRTVARLSTGARKGTLNPEQLRGATFAITNLGGLGTTHFTPLVMHPLVSLLGVGRAATRAVWTDEGFEPRSILPLSIAYDHRAVDGADAARFLRSLAETLERPWRLWLPG